MTLPAGFSYDVVAGGFFSPTAFAFLPDGRILVAEKPGVVRLIKNGVLLPTPFIDLTDRINSNFDRGLLGLAVDIDFTAHPYVYLYYTYENDPIDWDGPKTARLTRVLVTGDTAAPASEQVILGTVVGSSCNNFPEGADCLPSDAGSHSAGNVKFGSDGTLYLTVGDAADFTVVTPDALRSQSLNLLAGKVLRVTRAGKGVPTNPFWDGNPDTNRSKVWAYGLRNAYRLSLRPGSNVPYVGDVGWGSWEEISVASAGANLGWPCYEGSAQQGGYASNPICQALYAGGPAPGAATPIARVMTPQGTGGPLTLIQDGNRPAPGSGDTGQQYDSWDGFDVATEDWVGYQYATPQTFTGLAFQEGMHFWDGGWFTSLTVQVRQNGQWVGVSNLAVTPAYAGNNGVSFETYTFTFDPTQGDAIRLYGAPGGTWAFISVGELEVFGPEADGGDQVEVPVKGQGEAIARVMTPQGTGGPLTLIQDGNQPAPGSGDASQQYDSWDGLDVATEDWVGYQFATPQTFTRLAFQEGMHFWDGGWFTSLTVQVRQNGQWVGVSNLAVTPAYAGNNGVSFETYTFTFDPTQGDAIRLHGAPGGTWAFISVGELDVFALGSPPATSAAKPPLFEYSHLGESAAVTAGTFYTGTVYPAQYQGAYFFGDFSLGLLRTLRVDDLDNLVPGSVADFAQDAEGPVDIEMGPDGLIYYIAISTNELRRIRYTAGNTPPQAVAAATPTSGLAPLSVQFSSAGSSDPDEESLTFEWDFGDGTPPETGASPQHTYAADGSYVATVTVRDTGGASATDTVTITVGNLPPVAAIATPLASLQYKVGDLVSYSGSATSPPQDPIPGATLTWQIILHHCPGGACHAHPYTTSSGPTGSFTVPDHGDESHF
jgi:glucose/arabinose dehydrogenase